MTRTQAEAETRYRLSNFIMLNLYKRGIISREQYIEIRDKLIDEYKPIIGELERGLPWILDELEK